LGFSKWLPNKSIQYKIYLERKKKKNYKNYKNLIKK